MKLGMGSKADYIRAKVLAKRAVYHAKSAAERAAFADIDLNSTEVFRLSNQMRGENQDIVRDKPIRNDAGEMCLDEESKRMAWKEHYERLANVEFVWDPIRGATCGRPST